MSFASVNGVVRIDRDVRPVFLVGAEGGGLVNAYPRVTSGWTGNQFGDVYVGGMMDRYPAGTWIAPQGVACAAIVRTC